MSLLIAAGWAVYLYGYGHTANAKTETDIAYVRDAQLPELVRHLESVSGQMRRHIELLEHAERQQALRTQSPTAPSSSKPLRDPFTPIP